MLFNILHNRIYNSVGVLELDNCAWSA